MLRSAEDCSRSVQRRLEARSPSPVRGTDRCILCTVDGFRGMKMYIVSVVQLKCFRVMNMKVCL